MIVGLEENGAEFDEFILLFGLEKIITPPFEIIPL